MFKRLFIPVLIAICLSSCISSLHSIVTDDDRIFDDRIIAEWLSEQEHPFFTDVDVTIETDDPHENVDSLKSEMISFIDSLNSVKESVEKWTFDRAANITWEMSVDPVDSSNGPSEIESTVRISQSGIPASQKYPLRKAKASIVIDSIELLNYYLLTVAESDDVDNDNPSFMRVELTQIGKDKYMDFTPHQLDAIGEKYSSLFPENIIGGHSYAKYTRGPKGLQISPLNGNHIETLLRERRIRLKHEIVEYRTAEDMEERIVITASTQELRAFLLKYGDDPALFDEPIVLQTF